MKSFLIIYLTIETYKCNAVLLQNTLLETIINYKDQQLIIYLLLLIRNIFK